MVPSVGLESPGCTRSLAFMPYYLTLRDIQHSRYTDFTEEEHYIRCHLADAFIQSDLQLIRLNRRHISWGKCAPPTYPLAQGPTAVQISSWPHLGSNRRPCGSKSSSLTTLPRELQSSASDLPIEIVEEGEQVESQLAPALFLTVCQDVGVHDRVGS